jgi:NADP-dependent 3-hydroxy acid dehydrogenase YdfG
MGNNIAGKVIVMTGASRGLGEATARLLSARAVAFAISQPEEIDVNEILFRPTRQEL